MWTSAWDLAWTPPPLPPEVKAESDVDPALAETFDKHGAWMDAALADFRDRLRPIVEDATHRLEAILQDSLQMQDGNVLPNAHNQSIMDRIDDLWLEALAAAGYLALVANFTAKFPEQMPFLQETLDWSEQGATVSLTDDQRNVLAENAGIDIQVTMRNVVAAVIAMLAAQRSIGGVQGVPFERIVAIFQDEFGGSVKRNVMRAETAIAVWYRNALGIQYDRIQARTPDTPLKYVFLNPIDSVTRPWCRHTVHATAEHPLTRDEIDKLDNGQTGVGTAFWAGGGFGCRGAFVAHRDKE